MAELRGVKVWIPARLRDSGGFALAMAIFALVLLAAIVAGGYFSASQEFNIGRGMKSTTTSFYAGEAGIQQVLEDWDPTVYGALLAGDTITIGPIGFEGGGSYTASVVRVGSAADSAKRYFYIESVGRPASPTVGERRQAVVVRATFPELCCDGAVKTYNQVLFGGGAQPIISGLNDDPPGTWPASACAGIPADSAPGVIVRQAANVNDPTRVQGQPPIWIDPTITPPTMFDFGDLDYDDLVAIADHQFPDGFSLNNSQPTVVGGKCDRSNPLNWGAPSSPSSPCFNYFPIIHVTGDLSLTGNGEAQGILLVDRYLTINGPFKFYGIALVKRDLIMGGSVDFYGGAVVGDDVRFNGATPRFWLSRCATERAERLSKLTRPRLISRRAWVELF